MSFSGIVTSYSNPWTKCFKHFGTKENYTDCLTNCESWIQAALDVTTIVARRKNRRVPELLEVNDMIVFRVTKIGHEYVYAGNKEFASQHDADLAPHIRQRANVIGVHDIFEWMTLIINMQNETIFISTNAGGEKKSKYLDLDTNNTSLAFGQLCKFIQDQSRGLAPDEISINFYSMSKNRGTSASSSASSKDFDFVYLARKEPRQGKYRYTKFPFADSTLIEQKDGITKVTVYIPLFSKVNLTN